MYLISANGVKCIEWPRGLHNARLQTRLRDALQTVCCKGKSCREESSQGKSQEKKNSKPKPIKNKKNQKIRYSYMVVPPLCIASK